MDFRERQDHITALSNEISDLSKLMRINSTDVWELRMLNVKLQSVQTRFALLIDMMMEGRDNG